VQETENKIMNHKRENLDEEKENLAAKKEGLQKTAPLLAAKVFSNISYDDQAK